MRRTIKLRNRKLTFTVTNATALIDLALKQLVYDALAGIERPLAHDPAVIRNAAKKIKGATFEEDAEA